MTVIIYEPLTPLPEVRWKALPGAEEREQRYRDFCRDLGAKLREMNALLDAGGYTCDDFARYYSEWIEGGK